MRTLIIIALLTLSSCGLSQSIVDGANRVQDIRIRVADSIVVTKNGVDIGNVNIMPTRIRVNSIDPTPAFYGITIKYTF